MKYNPYRCKIEPIHNVYSSEINFHPNHLEIVEYYDYTRISDGISSEDYVKRAFLLPKQGVIACRTSLEHIDQPEEEIPTITIDASGLPETIYLRSESDKEADKIYLEIRKWLLL